MKKFFLATICFNLLSTAAIAGCADSKSEFLAAVLDVDGNIEVWINTRENWDARGALVDSYTEAEAEKVDIITDAVKLCNLAESQYEPCRDGRTVSQIKAELKKACVEVDSDFQVWAEAEIE